MWTDISTYTCTYGQPATGTAGGIWRWQNKIALDGDECSLAYAILE